MLKVKFSKTVVFILMGLILASCATGPGMQIGNTVTLCCPGNYDSYTTFAVETVDMPIFLRDYMVSEFDTAFQERGLTRNDQRSDLIVALSYRHVNLDPETQNVDPFVRMESINVELNYIATIDITMRERAGGKVVWGGQISRIHSVSPGEYMHEGGARSAFLETFQDLLEAYPSRLD